MNTTLTNFEINSQIRAEERNQREIALLEDRAETSEDFFNLLFLKYGRVLCNGCGSPVLRYQWEDFHKNDGYCNTCNKS